MQVTMHLLLRLKQVMIPVRYLPIVGQDADAFTIDPISGNVTMNRMLILTQKSVYF